MIIANNFILEYNKYGEVKFEGTEEEYLDRLANAKVVIDKAFTKAEKTEKTKTNNLSKIKKSLETEADKFLISENIEKHQQAIKQLEELRSIYSIDYNNAYDTALKSHEADVKKLITEEVKAKQKELQEAQAALAELHGELGSASFDPNDPQSIENAIQSVSQMIDERVGRYASNPIIGPLIEELKEACHEGLMEKAAEARREAEGI